jgi:hypothetical protein
MAEEQYSQSLTFFIDSKNLQAYNNLKCQFVTLFYQKEGEYTMKITVLGSLGNINRYYLPRLIADGHDVTVITSSIGSYRRHRSARCQISGRLKPRR